MDIPVGLRMLRKAVAGLSVVAILLSFVVVSTASAAFTDVNSGDWFYTYVNQLVEDGIVDGSKGTFGPTVAVSRAEMAKYIVLAAGFTDKDLVNPATASFKDVPTTHAFYKYIETAKAHGFVNGDGGTGLYRPEGTLNRAEASKVLVGALELKQVTTGGPHFTDVKSGDWFYAVVETCYNWSVVDGVSAGVFKPADLLQRAQVAKMIVLAQSPVARGGVVPPDSGVGSLTVALSAASPAPTNLPDGSAYNNVAAFDFTAPAGTDVVIKGLLLTKGGYVANSNVSGISVWDSAGKRHGNVISTLSAEGQANLTFAADPITVKGGTTETVTVKINLSSTAGATATTVSFGLVAATDVTSTAATVDAVFPLSGATFGIVDGSNSLGAVTLDEEALNASGVTLNVNDADEQEIAKFSLQETSSKEDVKLASLTLYNYGNASATDYADVQLVGQDGTVLSTVNANGQYVTFDLSAAPYVLAKGQKKTFTVRAKIVNGATKTIQFVVYNDYDVTVTGASTKASLLAVAGSNDTAFPIGNSTTVYNKVTIGSGSLTFGRDVTSPSTAVTPGTTNVVLAKYYMKPNGEDMELRQISFGLDQNTSSVDLTGTVYVKVDGATVFSAPASDYVDDGTVQTETLSTYPTIKAGKTAYLTFEVSVSSSATSSDAYFVNDADVILVKRVITNDLTDPTVAVSDGYTVAVKSGHLDVTTLSTPVAASAVPGSNNFVFAKFELNAQNSGEDVKVSSLTVTDTLGSGTDYSGVTNLQMYDAAGNALPTSSSTSTNAATVAFNFTQSLLVTKTTPVVLTLKGDIVSSTGTSHTFNVAATDSHITAVGATTGNSITGSNLDEAGSGQAMAVTTNGALTMSLVSGTNATPAQDQLVTLGTTNGTYLAFRLTAQYEAIKITSFKITATGTALNQNDVRNIALYRGTDTTPFATAAQFASCSANVCTYTWTVSENLLPAPVDPSSPVTVYVKADIGGEGIANLGDDFYFSVYDVDTDFTAKGAATNTTLGNGDKSGTASPATVQTYIAPFTVVASADTPSSGSTVEQTVAAGTAIGRFKVTNNGSAAISLTDVTFTNNGSDTGTVETYDLYASNENSNNYTGTILANETVNSVAFGSGATDIAINGGAYRYLTVYIGSVVTGLASGDSWNLSIASLGDLKYSVAESGLGYSGNPASDNDLGDTVLVLAVDGKPVLGTITKK
ncbi:MAG: S-layer domain-containing protein [Candidatus Peregrinibacteria bacterium GW2011_GWF2_38_29]|nr:MAG: S-layer domain-containing protein [Candidatus Peregrinibacteria bacterium GW2011_GWF2_38_29]HBB02881.1 hypothetical protein [Candidatus Peregrinibacteria bacterium]